MQDGVRLVLGAIQRGWGAHDAFCEDGSFASRTIQPAPHLRDDKCKHVCNVCDSLYVCLCKSLKLFERALVVEDREKERGGKGKGGREGEAAPRSLSLSLCRFQPLDGRTVCWCASLPIEATRASDPRNLTRTKKTSNLITPSRCMPPSIQLFFQQTLIHRLLHRHTQAHTGTHTHAHRHTHARTQAHTRTHNVCVHTVCWLQGACEEAANTKQ